MKQSILKVGDSVRYHLHSPDVGRNGFGIGFVGAVQAKKDGSLYVQNGQGVQLTLVDSRGELSEWTDYFAKVNTLQLPVGYGQG